MAKSFTVDDTLFRAQAKKLVQKLQLNEPKFLKEEAGLLAQLFAKITPPFKSFPKLSGAPSYTTSGAQKQGANRVKADFNRAIKRMGTIRKWKSTRIRDAIRSGDTEKLTAILRNMRNSNKHNLEVFRYRDGLRKRNNRGRVPRNIKPIVGITDQDVNRGMKSAVNNVGIAKAAFAKAAVRLGRKKPPAWIAKHFSKVNTSVFFKKSPTSVKFVATAAGIQVTSSRIKSAERFRLRAMVKKLEKIVKIESKRRGFNVR